MKAPQTALIALLCGASSSYSFASSCDALFQQQAWQAAYTACQGEAQEGSAQAQYRLANLYAAGKGTAQDKARAVELLTLAAAKGHTDASFSLAVAYEQGIGVSKDAESAFRWYQAANNTHAIANRKIAEFYEQGKGAEESAKKAFEAYLKGAKMGDGIAQLKVGAAYLQDTVVAKDSAQGIAWLEKAAAQNVAEAQFALGTLLWQQSPERALAYYEQATENGNTYAMHNLASIYLKGEKLPQDLEKARYYAQMSIAHGQLASNSVLEALKQMTQSAPEQTSLAEANITAQSTSESNTLTPSDDASLEADNSSFSEPAHMQNGFYVQLAAIYTQHGVDTFLAKHKLAASEVSIIELDGRFYVLSQHAESWQAASDLLAKLSQQLSGEAVWIRNAADFL